MSERNLKTLTADVVQIIKATDLPPLPADGSESLDLAMRHVILWLAEMRRLEKALDDDCSLVDCRRNLFKPGSEP